MSKEHTPFRYDHVGSFLRPAKLKQARLDFQAGKIDAAALKAVEDEAIVDLVHKQQKAGYHAITDGEFRHVASGLYVGLQRCRSCADPDWSAFPRGSGDDRRYRRYLPDRQGVARYAFTAEELDRRVREYLNEALL